MKKKALVIACCAAFVMTGCGAKSNSSSVSKAGSTVSSVVSQPEEKEETKSEMTKSETEKSETEKSEVKSEVGQTEEPVTKEQALEAVRKYCIEKEPGLEEKLGSDDYTAYFNVEDGEDGNIVVLYRSYTGAQVRYYVDPDKGDVYVTD